MYVDMAALSEPFGSFRLIIASNISESWERRSTREEVRRKLTIDQINDWARMIVKNKNPSPQN